MGRRNAGMRPSVGFIIWMSMFLGRERGVKSKLACGCESKPPQTMCLMVKSLAEEFDPIHVLFHY